MPNTDAAGDKRELLQELQSLVSAAEAGDFSFSLSTDGLSEGDALTIRLVKSGIAKFRALLEYDIMRYKLTCQSMGMVMWDMDVVDGDPLNPGNKITWSQELRQALGFTDENDFPNVFASWIDRLHPEDKDRAISTCVGHILDRASDQSCELEFRVLHKDGNYRHFHAFGATLRDKDGTPLREAGSWLDITDRKAMESQIIDMNENLAFILDSMSVGIRIVRMEDGELVYANKASMDIFGCEDFERDIAGKSAFDFMPEVQPDGRLTVDLAEEFFGLDRVPMDFQCFRLSGELFTARITSCNVNYKGKSSSLAIIEDVTEQKRTEEQIKRRELMMDTLNESSVVFVSRDEDTFGENMAAGIAPIAELAGLERLSVWHNSMQADGLHGSMVYRWDKASGGTTKPTEELVDVAYAHFAPTWENILKENKILNSPVSLLPPQESAVLKAYGVVSALVVPVFIKNNFTGFVLFEDRKDERFFDSDCTDMLRYAAYLLTNAVSRAESERKIAEAEKRMKLMLDTSPMCCQLWDKNFKTIDCNAAAVRLYGFKDKQEYLDRFMPDCSPEFQPDGQRSDEKAFLAVQKAFYEGSCTFDWMHRIPADGSLLPAEIRLIRVNYNDDYAVIGYTRDMRAHNKAMKENAYRDSLMRAVNSVAELLLTSEAINFEQDVNKSLGILAKALGVGCACMWRNHKIDGNLYCDLEYDWIGGGKTRLGQPWTKDVPFTQLPSWEGMLSDRKCINAVMTDIIEEQGEDAQKLLKAMKSILVVPIIINDVFWGFAGFDDFVNERVFTEVEESLMSSAAMLITNAVLRHEMLIALRETYDRLETALTTANEANRIKSIFLANMSHEIRTPMNSIMGFAELARDGDVSAKTRDYLLKISDNADWMLHIINDILDISKIESGKLTLERIPFDVHDIYEHCKSMIMPKVEEKGLSLYCYAEPSIGKKLIGDPIRLRQVITNLLSNAVKFTNSGTIKLLASVVSSGEDTAVIHFEVKDSGIGISPMQLDKIFEPFIQGDGEISRKYTGTGLGLAITKNLVEMMGGELKVTSAVGIGSMFSFEIPFALIDAPSGAVPAEKANGQAERPKFNAEILICEDNEMNQQVVCEHLTRVGIQTVVAYDGKEGVDIIAQRHNSGEKPFDLIFMDIHMPVMDGLEAAQKISGMGVKTPIVALTANVMINDLEVYKANGMQGYLGKPFSSRELYKCLMKYITPWGYTAPDKTRQYTDDEMLLDTLKRNFVKGSQTAFADISRAVDAGGITLAHRLVHTLKSNAGNIGETRLQAAAAGAEDKLKGNINRLEEGQLGLLGAELEAVLEKYAYMLDEGDTPDTGEIADKADILTLLEKLAPLLTAQDMACMDMLGDIRRIPGADRLARCIEDFEFEKAAAELEKLK